MKREIEEVHDLRNIRTTKGFLLVHLGIRIVCVPIEQIH